LLQIITKQVSKLAYRKVAVWGRIVKHSGGKYVLEKAVVSNRNLVLPGIMVVVISAVVSPCSRNAKLNTGSTCRAVISPDSTALRFY
jgi:hypothetical protein